MKVRFAVAPDPTGFDASALAALVDGLEERRFDTVWLSDVPLGQTLDPVVGLGYAAGRTRRLKLGANIVPVGRNPFRLAKELAQLDQLAAGRILLSLVPGLNQPGERETLGIGRADRGAYIDEVVPLLRRWWAGDAVDHRSERFHFPGLALRPVPVQTPLEIWLGGIGPRALDRTGRIADGWLGAALTAPEAGTARARIEEAASAAGRVVDPEHFGLSTAYARTEPPRNALEALRGRRPDVDPGELLPVGRDGLRATVDRYLARGISKFVLRPAGPVGSWDEELDWLAGAVLDLQT